MTIRFTLQDAGCYLEGAHGWHNNYRVVDLAVEYGMKLDADDQAILAAYRSEQAAPALKMSADDVNMAVIDQGELADKATEYLQSVTAEDLLWTWDGDLILMTAEEASEAAG